MREIGRKEMGESRHFFDVVDGNNRRCFSDGRKGM